MKKILGILGVAVIAATMFFSTNNVNGSSSDASLASLMNMNVAHASDSETAWFEELVTDIVYNDEVSTSGTIEFAGVKVPLGFKFEYSSKKQPVGYTINCEGFAFAVCDQSKVGVFKL